MLLARRKPDDIARPDFLDRACPALDAAEAGGDDQCLSERVGMPGGACARLESNAGAAGARGVGRLEQRVDFERCR